MKKILLGNEAIGYGLLESGCSVATSYPGTPASEILETLLSLQKKMNLCHIYAEWSINEKIAFEMALAASYTGIRTSTIMKQVGLNVASDPLMSSAYTGTKGGFLIISADDPGPHSSQTEQDSRFFAMLAKIPVLDPSSPEEAKNIIPKAYEISEAYEIPVMLRPTTRVCHARQDIELGSISEIPLTPFFNKDPTRWAATPRFRYLLHARLNQKVSLIKEEASWAYTIMNQAYLSKKSRNLCIVSSGIVGAYAAEVLQELDLWDRIPLIKTVMPYPLSIKTLHELIGDVKNILVLEETYPLIELQLRGGGGNIIGRETNLVPREGELLPDKIETIIRSSLKMEPSTAAKTNKRSVPLKPPTLCPGCGHRPVFFAIRKAFPKGIYPSDIGCYTLGVNIGAVDTVLCMGASISQGMSFSKVFSMSSKPVIATIGDSTFFHSGIPALVNAVVGKASFIVVILNNATTAMTGHQPTPEVAAYDKISLENIVKACGVDFVEKVDAYDVARLLESLKRAGEYAFEKQAGVAVIIAQCPCVTDRRRHKDFKHWTVKVTDKCKGCQLCIQRFACPALESQGKKKAIKINHLNCYGCGVCAQICPFGGLERCERPDA